MLVEVLGRIEDKAKNWGRAVRKGRIMGSTGNMGKGNVRLQKMFCYSAGD